MSLQSIFLKTAFIIGISLMVFFGFVEGTGTAHATSHPTIDLSINGGSSATVPNGQAILIEWYIDGTVTNCSINNGIGPIDVSVLPVTGSTSLIPPSNGSTEYILNCDGITNTSIVYIDPVITLYFDAGTNYIIDSSTGYVPEIILFWESQFATRCSDVWYEEATNPGVPIYATNGPSYSGQNGTDGWVTFSSAYAQAISETSTFYITCYNDLTGTESTKPIVANVDNTLPPGLPSITISSPQFPIVQRSLLYGYAYVDISWQGFNISSCSQSASYDDGTPYASSPLGWSVGPNNTNYDHLNIEIATTTNFTVTCSRGAVTIGGTLYPATSTSATIRIQADLPPGVLNEAAWDRSALPPVTASINVTPNPATKNSLSGVAQAIATVTSADANYCELTAYETNNTPLDFTDDVLYYLNEWTRTSPTERVNGDGATALNIEISTTTRLSAYCVRDYDLLYGDAAEVANGTETVDEIAVAQDSVAPTPAPVAYVYGNAVVYEIGLVMIGYPGSTVVGFTSGGPGSEYSYTDNSGSIEFPFWDPHSASGTYNIHYSFCDESDGESVFKFFIDGVEVGTHTTNNPNASGPFCSKDTTETAKVASAVPISEGATIRIECVVTGGVDEKCMTNKLFFGTGDGGILPITVDPSSLFLRVPMMWLSENATYCDDIPAIEPNGNTFSWFSGSPVNGYAPHDISTTTEFGVRCGRTTDGLEDISNIIIEVPDSVGAGAGASVTSGDCIDGSGFYVPAPIGYGKGPGDVCTLLVDLAAKNPSISSVTASEDNINGTYDNISARLLIENLGPGDLPLSSDISYMASIVFDPVFSLPQLNSLVDSYDGTIPAFGDSPILSHSLNGIPFGNHTLSVRVNLDGSPSYPEDPTKLINNISDTAFYLPVPPPPMSIDTNKEFVRAGEAVAIDWTAHTSYTLNCSVRGAGGVTDDFDASANYPGSPSAYVNSAISGPINNTSEFTLTCVEPITGESFIESVIVEVVPDYEER